VRTVPSKFSTDLAANTKQVFYLAVVKADDGNLYWHTSPKTFSLWPGTVVSHGGSALTKSALRLAAAVDGEQIPLGTIQGAISISSGGGVGSVSNMTLTLLNQDGYNTTLGAKDLINRVVEIRKGFVDTVNGVGVNDMLLVKSFVIDGFEEYDFSTYTLTLVDGSFLRHKTIPNIIVEKEDYPFAPERSYGERIPILYGDFLTANTSAVFTQGADELTNKHFGKFDLAPTLVVDKFKRRVAVSEIGPINQAFQVVHSPTEEAVGIMVAGYTFSDTPVVEGYVAIDISELITADYFFIPIARGDIYTADSPVYDWSKAVDYGTADDPAPDTYADATHATLTPTLTGRISTGGLTGQCIELASQVITRTFLIWEVPSDTGATGQQMIEIFYQPRNAPGEDVAVMGSTAIPGSGGIAKAMTIRNSWWGYGRPVDTFNNCEIGIRSEPGAKLHLFHACMQLRVQSGVGLARIPIPPSFG
jgi:hypothetical protein